MTTVSLEPSPPRPATVTVVRRPLHRVAMWTALGTLSYSGAQAGVIMVLAKLGSASVVGDYGLALAVAAPITALGRLGMRPLLATETRGHLRFQDYLAVQLLTAPVCLAVLALVGWLGPFRSEVAWTIVLLGAAKLAESTGTVFYGLFDRHERQRRIALSMCLKGFGGVAAVAVTYWFTRSTIGAAAALGTWWMLILLTNDAPLASRLCHSEGRDGRLLLRPRLPAVTRIVKNSASVGGTAAIRELNLDLPYYFLGAFHGGAAVGFFAGVVAMNKLARVIFRGFNQAASPRLADHYRDNRAAFVRLSRKLLVMCGGLGLLAVVVAATVGDHLLALIYRPEFAAYQSAWVWLSVEIGFGLTAVALRQAMIAARYLKAQVPQVLLTTVVLCGSCALLVPRYGVNGAAMACVIASIFDALTSVIVMRVLFRRAAAIPIAPLDG